MLTRYEIHPTCWFQFHLSETKPSKVNRAELNAVHFLLFSLTAEKNFESAESWVKPRLCQKQTPRSWRQSTPASFPTRWTNLTWLVYLFWKNIFGKTPFSYNSVCERTLRAKWATIAARTLHLAAGREPTLLFVTERDLRGLMMVGTVSGSDAFIWHRARLRWASVKRSHLSWLWLRPISDVLFDEMIAHESLIYHGE